MCGRTACSLCEDSLSKAFRYKKKANDKKCEPFWRDINTGHKYNPSYNQSPTQYLPVLLMASHFDSENCDASERIFAAMRWGLIPSWHTKDPKEFKLSTINCRADKIDNRLWKTPFNKGFRCVVVVEGYFEWAKNGSKKQPHFFYFPQKQVSFKDRSWIKRENELCDSSGKWKGPRLLTLAAIFDRTEIDGKELYSFAIITVKSHKKLDWVHDRMPAVLDGEEAVKKWLDYKHVSANEAIKLLVPCDNIEWHAVTTDVGNVRNHSINNVLPIDTTGKKQKTIESFFKPKSSAKIKNEDKQDDDEEDDEDDDDVKDEKDSNEDNLKKRARRKRKQK